MNEKLGESQTSKETSPARKFRLIAGSLFMILAGLVVAVAPWAYMFYLIRDNSTSGMMAAGAVSWFAPFLSLGGIVLMVPGFALLVKVIRGRLPLTPLERFQVKNPNLSIPSKIEGRVWRSTAIMSLVGSLAAIALNLFVIFQTESHFLFLILATAAVPLLVSCWVLFRALIAFGGSTNSYLTLNRALKIVGISGAFYLVNFAGGVATSFGSFANSVAESSASSLTWIAGAFAPVASVLGWYLSSKWLKAWRLGLATSS